MKSTLFGFGVVYLVGAAWLILDVGQMLPMRNLAVLAFLLPGVVAMVGGLEVARLRRELQELRGQGEAPGTP